jgi:hypothetical protein
VRHGGLLRGSSRADAICHQRRSPAEVREYASGLLMRPWLPWGPQRRLTMLVLIAAVLTITDSFHSYWPLLLLAIAAAFSLRLVGEDILFLGEVARNE